MTDYEKGWFFLVELDMYRQDQPRLAVLDIDLVPGPFLRTSRAMQPNVSRATLGEEGDTALPPAFKGPVL